ncbi:3,4-dihydroxy-2-butanone-4-phosphate synthase [Terriglobus aquaticus]|uniref:3,4-dihydroxy-2-butanone 4-phosphate synthase n=1 Tax=Terriglobus aquaticus TaxID=940139 RepID=A0ABW9KLM5_9BACT|nr:3,4-dihydroxy-2-butanone-4-phosphate synthase [Terriglobus aquaticus]
MAQAPFVDVPEALRQFAEGKIIVVVDDEDRENEGDLTLAAEFATPEAINFMAKYGRGLICLTLTEERADYLRLPPMATENTSRFGTAFTESIEAREGVTTGISAADRAHTILTAVRPGTTAADLARPGHVFPLRARKGGVLVRAGQTEASVDLARMAGLIPAGVICEIMNDDGTMARVPDLVAFCREHNLAMLTVAELIRYRLQTEQYLHRVGQSTVQTPWGEFQMLAYASDVEEHASHFALVRGDLGRDPAGQAAEPVLVRVHTHAVAGGVLQMDGDESRRNLEAAMQAIAEVGKGALIYLHNASPGYTIDHTSERERAPGAQPGLGRIVLNREHSGRGRGEQTLRHTGVGSQMLADLGLRRIRLLVSRPTHVPALQGFGLEIVEQVPLIAPAATGLKG